MPFDLRRGVEQWPADRSGRAAAILLVVAVAAFFRLHQIETAPPGLFIDEAVNGLDAHAIATGQRLPVFLTVSEDLPARGREPMFHYLMALLFSVFGPTIPAVRATAALVGIATVIAFYQLCRQLFPGRIALYAALLMACGRWHVTFSRLGMRALLVPLWLVLTLLAALWLARARTRTAAIGFGATLGLGFYTYPAYWVVPPLVAALLAMLAFRNRAWFGSQIPRLVALAVLAAVLTVLPLALFATSNPDDFFARTVETYTAHDPLDAFQRLLFMLHIRGDAIPQHNIPLRPLLDPITGVLFIGGLAWMLWDRRVTLIRLGIVVFWIVPLFPSAFSISPPHAMRSLGSTPAVYLIAGIGLAWLEALLLRALAPRGRTALLSVPVLLLIVAASWNYRDFFVTWARDPVVASRFNADIPRFVDYLRGLSEHADVHATPYVARGPTIEFIELERPANLLMMDVDAFVAGGRDRVYVSERPELNRLIGQLYPQAVEIGRFSVYGAPAGRILRVPAASLPRVLPDEWRPALESTLREMNEAFARRSKAW